MGNSLTQPDPSRLPTAGLLRRIAALIYDAFLLFAITFAYGIVLLLIKILFNGIHQLEDIQPSRLLQWLSTLGWLASLISYYYVCWRKRGQTLGMKAWCLKLQQADGSLATPAQCLNRSLLAILSMALAGIGYFWCLLPPRKACLHDLYSKTRVVVTAKATP